MKQINSSATQIAIAGLLVALGTPRLAVIAYLICAVLIDNDRA